MKKFFLYALRITHCALLIAFLTATAHAEMQTYEGVGEYSIMQGETLNAAKQQAKERAERDALEQIYFYVRSDSSSKNSTVDKDEVSTIAAGLMNVLKTTYDVSKEDGALLVKATVVVEVDPDKIAESVEREMQRRNLP